MNFSAPPPVRQNRVQQKSFLFLLEEKIQHAQIRKSEENFFVGWRASARGGGAERQFRSKKVRAFSNKGHHKKIAYFTRFFYGAP